MTKRSTEHFFAYESARSGGRWSMMTGNPGDIVGPVLSAHQARDTWQAGLITQGFLGVPWDPFAPPCGPQHPLQIH